VATLDQIVQRCVRRMRQTAGTGAQRYSEDVLGDMVQSTFDMLFQLEWWPQFNKWYEFLPLDGVTGVVTSDLSAIKKFEDIRFVFLDGYDRPLPQLNDDVIPANISGNTPRFIDPINVAAKVFRVLPMTSTAFLHVRARIKPADFLPDDEVPFDATALMEGACYRYLADDGNNPGSTEAFRNAFETYVKQMRINMAQAPIQLDPRSGTYPTDWVPGP